MWNLARHRIKSVREALENVILQELLRFGNIACQCGLEHALVFISSLLPPIGQNKHLIAQVFVVNDLVKGQKIGRPARLNKGFVEFPVIALPRLTLRGIASEHFSLHQLQLVMGRNEIAFPILITIFNGSFKRRTFEQGMEIYEPDIAAFREQVQSMYLESEFATTWPEGVLEQINALGN